MTYRSLKSQQNLLQREVLVSRSSLLLGRLASRIGDTNEYAKQSVSAEHCVSFETSLRFRNSILGLLRHYSQLLLYSQSSRPNPWQWRLR